MEKRQSLVTVHMATSLDGFIARRDGRVDWMETADEYAEGVTLDPQRIEAYLKSVDCYVMGSRTYETALGFHEQGLGWPYGDKPVFVLSTRSLRRAQPMVEFYAGDLARLIEGRLRPAFPSIWIVGGAKLASECLRRGLADELSYSVLPVLLGSGLPFCDGLDRDVALHLIGVEAYKNGMVELRYQVRKGTGS